MKKSLLPLFLLLTFFSQSVSAQIKKIEKPKLVLVLVIDQFRADTIGRYENRFLPPRDARGRPGGFRFLMEEGAYFPLAEYGQLQNMTCPGHATILSGAYSYRHGIGLNQWYDRESGKLIYCVEDAASPLVGASREGRGISPRNFIGTTIGDELKNSGYKGQSVSIALKDRSSVLLGGYRNDLALWFDSGRWISSQYYLPDGKLPVWVSDLNASILADSKTPYIWDFNVGKDSRSHLKNDGLEPSKWIDTLGPQFPHKIAKTETAALMTPYATQLTLDAALAALKGRKLGHSPDTDILAVSFSAHDFLVHNYGPNSPQAEALTLDEDKALAKLFSEVQNSVGLKDTIIILTADHGGSNNPNWLKNEKLDAGRLDEALFVKQAEAFLARKYGSPKSGPWVLGSQDYNLYLSYPNIKAAKETREKVSDELARYFRSEGQNSGISEVMSGHEIETYGRKTGPLLEKLIYQTYQRSRSGDVILIPKANYIQPKNTADHISGYAYDRYVPLFVYGPNIKAGTYAEKADVVDIAPTLAFLLGTTPPTGSEGRVLDFILREPSK